MLPVLPILVIASSLLLGITITSKMSFLEDLFTRIAFGIPLGIVLFSFVLILFYVVFGKISWITTSVTILVACLLSFYMIFGSKNPKKYFNVKKKYDVPFAVVIAAVTIIALLSFIFVTSAAPAAGGSVYCYNNEMCSDILYHIGIGNSVVYKSFPPAYPFSIDSINVFPFVFDMYTMLLVKFGFTLYEGIIITDLIMLAALGMLSLITMYKLTKNSVASIAGAFIFWFGTGYVVAVFSFLVAHYVPLLQWINNFPPLNYSLQYVGMQYNGFHLSYLEVIAGVPLVGWVPILSSMLMQQRDFLLGLALGLCAIFLTYHLLFDIKKGKTERRERMQAAVLLGMIIGMLPLTHPPTLVVLLFVLIFAFVYRIFSRNGRKYLRYEIPAIAIPALLLALPQLYYMHLQRLGSGWFTFVYQRVTFYGGNVVISTVSTIGSGFIFWFDMLGLTFLLGLIGVVISKNKKLVLYSIPFFILLIFVMFISLQPTAGDSNKLILYTFFILSVFSGLVVNKVWEGGRKNVTFYALAVVLVVMISGSFLWMYYQNTDSVGSGYYVLSPTEIQATQYITNNTPLGAVFVVNIPSYFQNQPVPSVAGRQTVLSEEYYTSIEEHTLRMQTLENITAIVLETGSCELSEKYNVSYVYLNGLNASDAGLLTSGNYSVVFNQYDNIQHLNITILKSRCAVAK